MYIFFLENFEDEFPNAERRTLFLCVMVTNCIEELSSSNLKESTQAEKCNATRKIEQLSSMCITDVHPENYILYICRYRFLSMFAFASKFSNIKITIYSN